MQTLCLILCCIQIKRREACKSSFNRRLQEKSPRNTIEGDEKTQLWKRWGDPYDRPMIINGEQDKNTIRGITPFSNALATI